ncbi:uncharacterized protein IWZ02DRAFT_206224 [Phyllosticta citriasiana]|uniref:uncharacterized protein n=1 Tax=Phyllosticta citriasiana TaxID=595635 RepID=UPI0030FDC00B
MDAARPSRRNRSSNSVPDHHLPPCDQDEPSPPTTTTSSTVARLCASTIRPVTPDSNPDPSHLRRPLHATTDTNATTFDGSNPSPGTSPKTVSNHHDPSKRRGIVTRTASNDGEYAMRTSKETPNRPRTRTLEERPSRDRSPASLFAKSRHRIGSVHSTGTGSSSFPGLEDTVHSIGHPSISPPSASTSSRTNSAGSRARLTKAPPRAQSPVTHHSPAQPDSWVSPVPASDAKKILKLMRSTCGRMKGMLAFRRGESSPWALSYCYINEETGSLVYEPKNDHSYHRTLIPDLRGCRVKTAYDAESYTAYVDVTLHNSNMEVHLRPPTQEEYDSWFAALLCWQPIRPKGIQNKMAKPQQALSSSSSRSGTDNRRHSEISLLKEAPIIKVGKMIYWDTNVSYANAGSPKPVPQQPVQATVPARPAPVTRLQSFGARRWRRVSCTLRENGELKLYSDTDVTLVSVVQLSQLSRCAVQRLDPSVLDTDFCIAIYPQYTAGSASLSLLRPIFLSLDSRVQYEVWIVLLRAFTIPQLYGPKQPSISLPEDLAADSPKKDLAQNSVDMFRMERSLSVKIIEARLPPPLSPKLNDGRAMHAQRPSSGSKEYNGGYYVEILLDGETRARTMLKDATDPFWREEFDFGDLPAVLSTASLLLKKRPTTPSNAGAKPAVQAKDSFAVPDGSGGYTSISFDQTCGKVDIYLDDMDSGQEVEKWWPMLNMYGNSVGELLVRVKSDEGVILMARDYQPMSELLHRFSNGLTVQIAQMISGELKRLSECLLNIFQVSGQASEWIMALVEEEIDGTLKETSVSRLRFSRRMGSGEGGETTYSNAGDRELVVRDMGNNAKLEANLLFRGNTLLTKALDFHMKRLGKEYLEETLGEKLQEIADRDPECEVDPNRVQNQHEIDRNWKRLIQVTEDLWHAIYTSVNRCPPELRLIFRHIRACAEDRYGDFLRTVTYSSVSGFLFLRFFCPAVLNPKLFGLLKDHPKMRARRTLTLVAKSLQGLANMSTLGAKEHWMEPMNAFLNNHRQEFKDFIDNICAISPNTSLQTPIPPSYSTPLAILQRLPPTSREGFPSLPYLIDHARNFAELVQLWLDHAGDLAENLAQEDGDLGKFHNICVTLNARTRDCLERAERAERPSSNLSVKWEELVEQLEANASDDRGSESAGPGPQDTPLVPKTGSLRRRHRDTESSAGTSQVAQSPGPLSPTTTIGTLPIQGGSMSPMFPIQGANASWPRDPWDYNERDAVRMSDSTTAGTLGSVRSMSQIVANHRAIASSPARSAGSANTPQSSSRYAPSSTETGLASGAGSVKDSIEETSDEDEVEDDGQESSVAEFSEQTPPRSAHGTDAGGSEPPPLHHSQSHSAFQMYQHPSSQLHQPLNATGIGPGGMAGGGFSSPGSVYAASPQSMYSAPGTGNRWAPQQTSSHAIHHALHMGLQSLNHSLQNDPNQGAVPPSFSQTQPSYRPLPHVATQLPMHSSASSPGGAFDDGTSDGEATTALPPLSHSVASSGGGMAGSGTANHSSHSATLSSRPKAVSAPVAAGIIGGPPYGASNSSPSSNAGFVPVPGAAVNQTERNYAEVFDSLNSSHGHGSSTSQSHHSHSHSHHYHRDRSERGEREGRGLRGLVPFSKKKKDKDKSHKDKDKDPDQRDADREAREEERRRHKEEKRERRKERERLEKLDKQLIKERDRAAAAGAGPTAAVGFVGGAPAGAGIGGSGAAAVAAATSSAAGMGVGSGSNAGGGGRERGRSHAQHPQHQGGDGGRGGLLGPWGERDE